MRFTRTDVPKYSSVLSLPSDERTRPARSDAGSAASTASVNPSDVSSVWPGSVVAATRCTTSKWSTFIRDPPHADPAVEPGVTAARAIADEDFIAPHRPLLRAISPLEVRREPRLTPGK